MSKERFDHLLDLVKDKISKKDTNMREAITVEERLVITLFFIKNEHVTNSKALVYFFIT